ncbi:MAG: sulfurtransferase [Firmicutes bacterium]|nr:sulfurtransferase [Bacillota bacterium]
MFKSYKKVTVILIVAMLISGFFIGCTNKTEENNDNAKESNYANSDYIVSQDWLSENLDNDEVLILDARGAKAYKKGHIPGAISVTWQEFSNMNGKPGERGWGVVLDSKKLSEKLSNIGVTEDKEIIVYSDTQNGWGEDGRFVWMFKMAGIDNAKMLDGGFNYWEANDYKLSEKVVTKEKSNFNVKKLNNEYTIDTDTLSNKLEEVVVLDSRALDEYNGAVKYGEKRGGHIPNAKLLSFKSLVNEDGTFKSENDLEKIFNDAGLKKDDEIVTYCTAGIRSAHLAITLRMMGYENAKNYDESFYAWAGDKNLKLVK